MKKIPYIILMDDDEGVRNVATAIIDRFGYEVEAVVKGEDAIDLFKSRQLAGLPIDAVFLDMNILNGLGGLETLAALREIDSDLKAILASGYSAEWIEANHPAHGFNACIYKPFRMDELRSILLEVIGEPGAE